MSSEEPKDWKFCNACGVQHRRTEKIKSMHQDWRTSDPNNPGYYCSGEGQICAAMHLRFNTGKGPTEKQKLKIKYFQQLKAQEESAQQQQQHQQDLEMDDSSGLMQWEPNNSNIEEQQAGPVQQDSQGM